MKSKEELYNILDEMETLMGTKQLLNEVLTGMSTDELREIVKQISRLVFTNKFEYK